MKLLRLFTNKGECKSLLRNIDNEAEFLLYALMNSNTPHMQEVSKNRQWFKRWQKMKHWQSQLRKWH